MPPEVAAIVGVLVGALLSGLISFLVNERNQAAEDKRLARMEMAERQRLEMQLSESVKKEQRDAAREARQQRLQPAIDFLTNLEDVFGYHFQSPMFDTVKSELETEYGSLDANAWEEVKAEVFEMRAPKIATVVATFLPRIASLPAPLQSKLRRLMIEIGKLSQMTSEQQEEFLTKLREARQAVDAEAVRGEWP